MKTEMLIGEGSALFFLIDLEKRRPMRIQDEQYDFLWCRWRYKL